MKQGKTIDRCENHGGPLVEGRCATYTVALDVIAERARQFSRYGSNDDLPDGSGPETRWLGPYSADSAEVVERTLRNDYEEFEEEVGKPTWVHLIREEVAEAFAESDPERLREELIQVAALCVSWVETLDTRALLGDPAPVIEEACS